MVVSYIEGETVGNSFFMSLIPIHPQVTSLGKDAAYIRFSESICCFGRILKMNFDVFLELRYIHLFPSGCLQNSLNPDAPSAHSNDQDHFASDPMYRETEPRANKKIFLSQQRKRH